MHGFSEEGQEHLSCDLKLFFFNKEILDRMGPGWKPAAEGLDIWQLEPSQEGNLGLVGLCYDVMAPAHRNAQKQ